MDLLAHLPDILPSKLSRYSAEIAGASLMKSVDPLILSAILWHESTGNPKAVSFDGGHGMGLGQIDDRSFPTLCAAYWGKTGARLVFEPDFNVLAAARLLRENLETFKGDLWPAVAAYNASPRRVSAALAKMGMGASDAERFAAANSVTWEGKYLDQVREHFRNFTIKAAGIGRKGKGNAG